MVETHLARAVLARADARPQHPALRYHRDGSWRELPWGELGQRVRALAAGLRGLGLAAGERVAIVSANRPEWALADLAAIAADLPVVSVYPTLADDETIYVLAHSGTRLAFVEDAAAAARIAALRPRLPRLEHVAVLHGAAPDDAIGLPELGRRGDGRAAEPGGAGGERPLTIVYTSGTTGRPKGVVLTHRNVLAVIDAVLEAAGPVAAQLQVNLSFLPLAHALERVAGHFLPLTLGRTIAYARCLETVGEDFAAVRPDFAVAVPRVFEKIHARIQAQALEGGRARATLLRWAMAVGEARSRALEAGEPVAAPLAVRHRLADLLVFRRLRAAFGGRVRLFVCGGAPLESEVARFFHAAGLLVCEGWGATETAAPATWNAPGAFRFGTVGRPLPGVEVRVATDGELEVRGPNVFPGYLDDPESTAAAFTADGFWRSGDIGHRGADGFFVVTDRKKELIVTSGGKNIAPSRVEAVLRQRPLVSNALVHGDRRSYLVALLTVDRGALAAAHPDLAGAAADDERLRALLAAEVAAANQVLARFEQVKRFAVVEPDFSPEGGELTITLKLKRRVVEERYRDHLRALYRG